MKGTDLYQAMQELDDALVEKYAQVRPKQRIPLPKLIAACLAVLLLIGGGAVAVDAITYIQAKDFFAENGLPTEGLSREEVRAVYRDITTKSFTYEKTDEVITKSISQAVPGYEITFDMDDPEKLRLLWESWENGDLEKIVFDGEIHEFAGDTYQEGIWYDKNMVSDFNYETEHSEIQETVIRKHENDRLCWESSVPFVARLIKPIGEGTVVAGENMHISGPAGIPREGKHYRIAYLDKNGQMLWDKVLTEEEGVSIGETDWAYDNGDETLTVIARGLKRENDNAIWSLIVWRYDLKGEQLSCKKIDVDGVQDVFQLEGRYVLSLSQQEGFACKLVVIEADGTVLTDAEYQITDQLQHIQDIAEVGNYLYISIQTMLPGEGLDEFGQPNVALTQDMTALWEQGNKISQKELVENIREHYTAVLLRCDIETSEIQTFYSISGMTADKLEVSESGQLIWHLQSLTRAEMKEASRYVGWIIRGTSVIYRYIFDAEGNLTEKDTTGELASYRW